MQTIRFIKRWMDHRPGDVCVMGSGMSETLIRRGYAEVHAEKSVAAPPRDKAIKRKRVRRKSNG